MVVELTSAHPRWTVTKYYGREVYVGHSLELGITVDPLAELTSDPNVLAYQRLQPLYTKAPDYEPELQRTEAATQGDTVIHQIRNSFAFTDYEKFGNVLEGAL